MRLIDNIIVFFYIIHKLNGQLKVVSKVEQLYKKIKIKVQNPNSNLGRIYKHKHSTSSFYARLFRLVNHEPQCDRQLLYQLVFGSQIYQLRVVMCVRICIIHILTQHHKDARKTLNGVARLLLFQLAISKHRTNGLSYRLMRNTHRSAREPRDWSIYRATGVCCTFGHDE